MKTRGSQYSTRAVRDRLDEKAYAILDSYRKRMFQSASFSGQATLDKLAAEIAETFHLRSLCILLYDFRKWRKLKGQPYVSLHGSRSPYQTVEPDFLRVFHQDIIRALKQERRSGPASISKKIETGKRGSGFYVVAAALAYPKYIDEIDGLPYLAALVPYTPEKQLDSYERRILERIIVELQRVFRFRHELESNREANRVLQDFLSPSTPPDIAARVVSYLSQAFDATEVAVLERRGMFLSVIGHTGVQVEFIPPLHIPTTTAIVCEVARQRKERYVPDVQRSQGKYLPIVSTTKTQYSVPLIWQRQLVGVLVLGLSVRDGLEESERQTIKALAGFCAAAIDGSRRNSDERAASHMLNEVIAAAALKVHLVTSDDKLKPAHQRKLADTFDLLNQCQLFVRNFRQAQTANAGRTRIDLREAIESYPPAAKLAGLLTDGGKFDIEIKPTDTPLPVFANTQILHMALHNIVVNSFEAMGDQGGRVSISLDRATDSNPFQPNTDFAIIRVVDDGQGISRLEQVQMLDLFYSTKPDHIGAGLNIVEDIVTGFGGHLQIFSPPRGAPREAPGTEVLLWIPRQRKGGRKVGRA